MGMESIVWRDFSKGWTPNVDLLKGAPNGFLNFDHCDLEADGAVLGGGFIHNSINVSNNVHTLFPRAQAGINHIYSATDDGEVWEDTTSIGSGGSTGRAAFANAFGCVFFCSGALFKKTPGGGLGVVVNSGLVPPTAVVTVGSPSGGGNLTGSYQWAQLYAQENTYGYVCLSTFGSSAPTTLGFTALSSQSQALTLRDPVVSGDEPTATHTYLYRRGGNLDQWYFVTKVATGGSMNVTDNLADSDVIQQATLTNTFNQYYLRVSNVFSSDGPVYAMVGLVYGRMLYFTAKNIYPSRINVPDIYDTRTSIGFGGGNNEVFLFAKKLSNNTVIIGTTADLYLMTGTFQETSPGVLDITITPLGVPSKPMGIFADVWNNHLVYFSASGWILYSPTLGYLQGETNICAGTTDRLYYAETTSNVNGFSAVQQFICEDSTGKNLLTNLPLMSCCVMANKLHVANSLVGALTIRYEVYDFVRKYWKTYQGIAGSLAYAILAPAQTNGIYFASGSTISDIGGIGGISNFGTNTVKLKTTFNDNGKSDTRKDATGLRIRCNSNSQVVTPKIAFDGSSSQTTLSTLSTSSLTETYYDLSGLGVIFKNAQIELDVAGNNNFFQLTDMELMYYERPKPMRFFKELRVDLPQGVQGRRTRLRVWPITIDSLGQNFTVTPLINGSTSGLAPAQTFNTDSKTTIFYQFTQDIPSLIDLGLLIESSTSTPFELYELGTPEIVQVFPIQKQFDQLGPYDIFRYGKLKALRIRLFNDANSNQNLPYAVYFQDSSASSSTGGGNTGVIAITAGIEDAYEIPLPVPTAGRILRIELGGQSLGYNFYRYNAQIQTIATGRDTEQNWITLPEQAQ